jgi:asparagine synthase (glutamine-hydrolysing)
MPLELRRLFSMAGIAGIISRDPSARAVLGDMLQSMLHEPFYRSGQCEHSDLDVAAGWVSHDRTFAAGMPVWNESRQICLIVTGEDFTSEDELRRLKDAGHVFDQTSADYLVHLYEEKGDLFFEAINGILSGILIDLREQKVIVFNDRYGLGRVYVHESAGRLLFASEAKALLKAQPALRELDPNGLGELLTVGCVLQDRSLFKGISLLPPASKWTFRAGKEPRKERYFSPGQWEGQPILSTDDYYEKLKEAFKIVLPRYFRYTDRAGMSLTGGLDSRMIMAWANAAPSQLPCYSHRGVFNECADAKIARRIAKVCDQPFRTLTLGGDFFAQFPSLAAQTVRITDGCADVAAASGLYVNRLAAREIAPVRMTGNYGSEVLRRNIAFKPRTLAPFLFDASFLPHLESPKSVYRAEKNGNVVSFVAFKQVPWHHYSRFALEQSQLTIRSPFLDNELVGLAYQAPDDITENRKIAERLIAEGNPALVAFPTDRGPLGRSGLLGKVSEQFQEFTFKAEYAYDYGMPQWLAKVDRTLEPLHLERAFLGRHKYAHYRIWYRRELAPFVREILLDRRSLARPYLNSAKVEEIVRAHVAGTGNYTSEIHLLLTAELIQRQLIEAN